MKHDKAYKVALALGAGGARGLAHIGVIESLEDVGLKIDYIAGSSIGAVIGALYCHRANISEVKTNLIELLEDDTLHKKWEAFVPRKAEENNSRAGKIIEDLRAYINNQYLKFAVITKKSLAKQEDLMDPLKMLFGDLKVSDLKIPFSATTVDLKSGQEIYLSEGRLTDILYASSAIPGIFPPLEKDGLILADGSITDLVPVAQAVSQDHHKVIAVDFGPGKPLKQEYDKGLDILMRADELARIKLNNLTLEQADLVISPEVADFHWAEFSNYKEIIKQGHEAAFAMLDELVQLKSSLTPEQKSWFKKLLDRFGS